MGLSRIASRPMLAPLLVAIPKSPRPGAETGLAMPAIMPTFVKADTAIYRIGHSGRPMAFIALVTSVLDAPSRLTNSPSVRGSHVKSGRAFMSG